MEEKRKILFVDDEENLLQGIKRMLRPMRREWDMSFANSPHEALERLQEKKFDVVISDMRMPHMDGAQLLKEVMRRHPEMVRIILSGYSEHSLIMKTVGVAHQYITKPCNGEALKAALTRTFNLRSRLSNDNLKGLVSKMDRLPSAPALYTELMKELQSPEPSIEKIARVIAKDVGMTAKILQFANSAFFGLRSKVSDPKRAVVMLGLEFIRSLVLSTKVFSQLRKADKSGLSVDSLWNHCMTTAVFAQTIAKLETKEKKLSGDCFTAGLLHDAGMLVLGMKFPEQYKSIIRSTPEGSAPVEGERETFQAGHGEVGGYLLGVWGLPDNIVEAVTFHHFPRESTSKGFSPLLAVHAANAFAYDLEGGETQKNLCPIDGEYIEKVGVGDRIQKWREACEAVLSQRSEEDEKQSADSR